MFHLSIILVLAALFICILTSVFYLSYQVVAFMVVFSWLSCLFICYGYQIIYFLCYMFVLSVISVISLFWMSCLCSVLSVVAVLLFVTILLLLWNVSILFVKSIQPYSIAWLFISPAFCIVLCHCNLYVCMYYYMCLQYVSFRGLFICLVSPNVW